MQIKVNDCTRTVLPFHEVSVGSAFIFEGDAYIKYTYSDVFRFRDAHYMNMSADVNVAVVNKIEVN